MIVIKNMSSGSTCRLPFTQLMVVFKLFLLSQFFKRELRVLALLGIEKLLGGRILSPGSANFRVLRLVKFVYEFCK